MAGRSISKLGEGAQAVAHSARRRESDGAIVTGVSTEPWFCSSGFDVLARQNEKGPAYS